MKTLRKTLLIVLGTCMAQLTSAQVAIVVGANSAASPLTIEQAAGLFLGKSAQLPGGGRSNTA